MPSNEQIIAAARRKISALTVCSVKTNHEYLELPEEYQVTFRQKNSLFTVVVDLEDIQDITP